MLLSIEKAAQHYKIASLRIDGLIRQGAIVKCVQIKPGYTMPEIMVDTTEMDRYLFENPGILETWQQSLITSQY